MENFLNLAGHLLHTANENDPLPDPNALINGRITIYLGANNFITNVIEDNQIYLPQPTCFQIALIGKIFRLLNQNQPIPLETNECISSESQIDRVTFIVTNTNIIIDVFEG